MASDGKSGYAIAFAAVATATTPAAAQVRSSYGRTVMRAPPDPPLLVTGLLLLTSGLRAQTASQVRGPLTSSAGTCGVGNAGGPGCLLLPMLGFNCGHRALAGTWAGVGDGGEVRRLEPFVPIAMTPWGATTGAPQQTFQNNGIWSGSFPGFVYIRASMDAPNEGALSPARHLTCAVAPVADTRVGESGATAAMTATPTRSRSHYPSGNPCAVHPCSPEGF